MLPSSDPAEMKMQGDASSVLVIEDEPDLRALMALVLEDRGYSVLTASDGREGLEVLGQSKPDVILLDMKMPVMDGWEFASRYRATFEHPAPIVVLTAAEDPRTRAEEVGAVAGLGKPVELDLLFAALEAALQRRYVPPSRAPRS